MTTEELLLFAVTRPKLTALEVELMQRLTIAMDMLQERTNDAGKPSQASH
jgi:hypothetical protein